MGLPMKHIIKGLKIGAAIAGLEIGDERNKDTAKLLQELVRQQKITNAVLLKMLEDQDPEAFAELMKELE